MVKNAFLALATVSVACLVECAPPPQRLSTPSGRPEVVINAPREDIIDVITNRAINNGWSIKDITPNRAVYTKLSVNIMLNVLLGSKYDSTPEFRGIFELVNVGEGRIRLLCTQQIVTNPGSAFERITPITNMGALQEIQASLLSVKQEVESRIRTGK